MATLNELLIAEVTEHEFKYYDLRINSTQGTTRVTTQDEKTNRLIEYCSEPRTRDELQQFVGIKTREYFRRSILKPLLESGQLQMTIPDKPNSQNQKYVKS